jgi:hypothetical protein
LDHSQANDPTSLSMTGLDTALGLELHYRGRNWMIEVRTG